MPDRANTNDHHAEPISADRVPLIDPEVTRRDFTSLIFSESHGAFDLLLGAGLIYYALVHMMRAQVAVCIGSGGGFVPALLRRAQIDSAIEPSATYMIDANLPELAFGSPIQPGGWMTGDSSFRTRESDIVILPMLSIDGAKLFAAHGLQIDYLHIDGDHSRDGMLSDFRAYLPLLSKNATVTAHDLSLPSITAAVQQIGRDYQDWEILSFPEVGSGTAILRKRQAYDTEAAAAVNSKPDKHRKVFLAPAGVTDAIDESRQRARFERWNYLATPTYRLRYRVVLDWIDEADNAIVEIGGFPNSVADLATRARVIHLIEAYAPPHFRERIEARSSELEFALFLHPQKLSAFSATPASLQPFNLVALGFDLSSGEDDVDGLEQAMQRFARLVSMARRAAIEVPNYAPSQLIWGCLAELLKPRIVLDVAMDLSQDPVADTFFVKDDRARRRIIVAEGTQQIDFEAPSVRAALRNAAERCLALRLGQETPAGTSEYALGTPILFHKDGNSARFVRMGWVGVESEFRWSWGKQSLIVCKPIEDEAYQNAKGFILTIDLAPFVAGELTRQRLMIYVQGHEVYRESLSARTTVSVRLPRALITSEEVIQISFTHPDCRQPAELIPGSKDRKHLAFRFYEMKLSAGIDTPLSE